jgi:hypothetical protein
VNGLETALPAGPRLLVSEHVGEDAVIERTVLIGAGTLRLAVLRCAAGDDTPSVQALAELPPGALDAVMRRYGKPLAEDVPEPPPELVLDDGAALSAFRHLARFDVIARDYVYYRPEREAPGLAALSVTVAAALRFLALRP